MCVTDRHDMTLAVKVALNPNATNQLMSEVEVASSIPGVNVSIVTVHWPIHSELALLYFSGSTVEKKTVQVARSWLTDSVWLL